MPQKKVSNMCKFCEKYKFWKEETKRTDKNYSTSHKIFIKMCIYGWGKGKRRIKRDVNSVIYTESFNLKYCPSCGRKLV